MFPRRRRPRSVVQSQAHCGSASASGDEAFRLTSGGGMVGLSDLPGGVFSIYASAVSGDGSVVVGSSIGSTSNGAATAGLPTAVLRRRSTLSGREPVDAGELDSLVSAGAGDIGTRVAKTRLLPTSASRSSLYCGLYSP